METNKKLETILGEIKPILAEESSTEQDKIGYQQKTKIDKINRPYELSSAPSYTDISPDSD